MIFSPGRVHFEPLVLGTRSRSFLADWGTLRRAPTPPKPRHSKHHKFHEDRFIRRDATIGQFYWRVLRVCGCGWRREYVERRLSTEEWHGLVVHGDISPGVS